MNQPPPQPQLRGNPYFYLISQAWHYGRGQRKKMVLFYILIFCANMGVHDEDARKGKFAALLAAGGALKNLWDKYEQT